MYRLDVIFLQLLLDDRVIIPVDERIVLRLVLDDPHLGIHIVLHLVMIPVEMVGRDIHQDSHVRTEIVHVIQLERAQLDDVVVMRFFRHLQSQTLTDISCQPGVISRSLEDMVDQ